MSWKKHYDDCGESVARPGRRGRVFVYGDSDGVCPVFTDASSSEDDFGVESAPAHIQTYWFTDRSFKGGEFRAVSMP
eukprot:10957203-Lingulodinium_polyedra.AAC.1